jgi:hypothetical protein
MDTSLVLLEINAAERPLVPSKNPTPTYDEEGLCVGVIDCVCEGVNDMLGVCDCVCDRLDTWLVVWVIDWLQVCDWLGEEDSEGDCDWLADSDWLDVWVWLGDRVAEGVWLCVRVLVKVCDIDDVADCDEVCVTLAVHDCEEVSEPVGVCVELGVWVELGDCVVLGLCVPLGETVPEPVWLELVVWLGDADSLGDTDTEGDSVWDGVGRELSDCVTLCDGVCVGVRENVCVGDGLWLTDCEGVASCDSLGESDGVMLGDGVELSVGICDEDWDWLRVDDSLGLTDCVADSSWLDVWVCDSVCDWLGVDEDVRVSLGVWVCDAVDNWLGDCVMLAVCDWLELPVSEPLIDWLGVSVRLADWLPVRDDVWLELCVTLRLCVTLGVCVCVAVDDTVCVWDWLAVPLCVRDCDGLPDWDAVRVAVWLGVGLHAVFCAMICTPAYGTSLDHEFPLSVLWKLPIGCANPAAGTWSGTPSSTSWRLTASDAAYTTTEYLCCSVVNRSHDNASVVYAAVKVTTGPGEKNVHRKKAAVLVRGAPVILFAAYRNAEIGLKPGITGLAIDSENVRDVMR